MAAVVRLLAVNGAAIAIEALVRISVDAEIVDHQDAGISQPRPDEAGEIEHRVSVALRWNEIHRVVCVGIEETLDEFTADLIALLADQGTDRRDHAVAL